MGQVLRLGLIINKYNLTLPHGDKVTRALKHLSRNRQKIKQRQNQANQQIKAL
jgi:hypothetical protein